jgi:putative nucleotidyltransferase with HDIG domain
MQLTSLLKRRITNQNIENFNSYTLFERKNVNLILDYSAEKYGYCLDLLNGRYQYPYAFTYLNNTYTFQITIDNSQKSINKNKLDRLNHSKDKHIFNHSKHVSNMCYLVGRELNLDKEDLKDLRLAALYHDIGKSKIPKEIINKPGPLTQEEWVTMRKHTILGYEILKNMSEFSRIADYAKYHHERIDGTGYPEGLKADEIPLISRIITVVDAYEAMTSDRPYRSALTKNEAIQELILHSGTQFDKNIVKVFINKVLINK